VPKVVDGKADAQRLAFGHHGGHLFQVVERGGFEDFQFDQLAAAPRMARQRRAQGVGKAFALQLLGGDVDADRQLAAFGPGLRLRQGVSSTQSPTWLCRPTKSTMGRNSPGSSRPRCGCCQRIRASTPTISPVRMLTLGW
jgi:hypothetical protein